MKSTNQKLRNNSFYALMILSSSISFAQTKNLSQETIKAKGDLNSAGALNNPYFKSNANQGEMVSVAHYNSNRIEINRQQTKSNDTNESIAKPNDQVDVNTSPPKSAVSNVLKTKHDTAKNSIGNIR